MKNKLPGNHLNRILSWLMVITILFTLSLPTFSLSEGTGALATDKIALENTATPEPTAEPTATPEPTAEPTATPEPTAEPTATPEPTAEPTATPEPTAEPTATPEPTAEPTATPVPTPVPYTGYASLTALTSVYGSATAKDYDYKLPKASDVYLDKATLTAADRIQINFAVDGEAQSGFVEPDTLKTLTADEQKDLVAELLKLEENAYYDDGQSLPLPELVPEYDVVPVTATPQAADATPELTATPTVTPTITPTATPVKKTILATSKNDLNNVMRNALKTYNQTLTTINCTSVSQLQSAHPYNNLTTSLYVYQVANAACLSVTFSSDTKVENPYNSENVYDVIGIYDAKDVLIDSFTGTDLAGKTISLRGNAVKILLLTDESNTYYGFRVTNVAAYTTPPTPSIAAVDGTHVRLSWSSSTLIQGYYIYRSTTAAGTYYYQTYTTGNSCTLTVPAGQVSYFKIRAYNDLTGANSGTKRYTSLQSAYQSTFPLAKAGIVTAVQNGSDSSSVLLGITPVAYATSYYVYRSTTATGSYSWVANVAKLSSVVSADPARQNFYKVRAACKSNGIVYLGPLSDAIYAPLSTVAQVVMATPSAINNTQMQLNWAALSGVAGYEVYRSTTSAASGFTWRVTTVNNYYIDAYVYGVVNYYKVRAFRYINGVKTYGFYSEVTSSVRYRALAIGQGYHNSNVSDLYGTLNDATGMTNMLSRLTKMNFNVTHLTDQTGSGILADISSAFAGATANDVSLFYYSGHGSEGGNLIGTDYYTASSGTVTPTQLRTRLDTIPGTKIVIVDSCYSGAIIGRSVTAVSTDKAAKDFVSSFTSAFSGGSRSTLATGGYYVITACYSTETSAEGDLESNGVTADVGFFTAPLSKGCGWNYISGTACPKYADTNSDSKITLSELYSYAYNVAVGLNSTQHAQCYPSGSSYALFVY